MAIRRRRIRFGGSVYLSSTMGGADVMKPPPRPAPFRSADEMVEAVHRLVALRERVRRHAEDSRFDHDEEASAPARMKELGRNERAWGRYFHESFDATEGLWLCDFLKELRLNRLEREIVMVLLLIEAGVVECTGDVCLPELVKLLGIPASKSLKVYRLLSRQGRLHKHGLVQCEDEDEPLRNRSVMLDPYIVEDVTVNPRGAQRNRQRYRFKSEQEFFKWLSRFTQALGKKASAFEDAEKTNRGGEGFSQKVRVMRMHREITYVLEDNPDWALASFFQGDGKGLTTAGQIIFLALLGKELGHLEASDELFTGMGLARAAANRPDEAKALLELLRPGGSVLIDGQLVQPAGGEDAFASLADASLARTEFELTAHSIELLGISQKLLKRRDGSLLVREPLIGMEQVVLAENVRTALDMALAQARHNDVLIHEWGFKEVIPYGRAVTLLFSGPPGVGKTACAEALAKELGRKILVADYARIQNCFVGMTEKNIVATFKAAKKEGAVLFWDEADAMFYDRNQAHRTWEVRDVNVLLQQIEQFDGVCILATNRRVSLDEALERRITLKVEFERPDYAARLKLWKKLLPPKMPLAAGVKLSELARAELTGGEIKNAVLNAARLALCRGPDEAVTMEDIERAVAMELEARKQAAGEGRCVGFCAG